jgi:arabinose-5-phosphate isomerase
MSYLTIGQRVLKEEQNSLEILANHLNDDFEYLADYIINQLTGRVILTGIGKSGYIARKISSSFASTGTASLYIHPAEASHGDLGMITDQDLVIILSKSGETKELLDILNYCKRFAIKIACITMKVDSTLAKNSDFILLLPSLPEASSITAPTTSTLMMLALGDSLTITVQESKGFNKELFGIYHPGGKIGAELVKVKNLMRIGNALPVVNPDTAFLDTLIIMTEKSLGCALVVDNNFTLQGIVTDGDLRRHLQEDLSNKTAKDVMSIHPTFVTSDKIATEALFIMNKKSITTLPVIEDNKLIGVIHIHDLLRSGVG